MMETFSCLLLTADSKI